MNKEQEFYLNGILFILITTLILLLLAYSTSDNLDNLIPAIVCVFTIPGVVVSLIQMWRFRTKRRKK